MKTSPVASLGVAIALVVGCGSSGNGPGGVEAGVSEGGTHSLPAADVGAVSPSENPGSLTRPQPTPTTCTTGSPDQQGCACNVGQTYPCYTGPLATRGVGTCKDGIETCQAAGEFGSYGACTGEVLPSSPTACIPPFDAGVDAGHDAGHDAGIDAWVGIATAGAVCTTGQTQAGPPGSVYYCDGSGVWETFPDGTCTAAACSACLQTNCGSILTSNAGTENAACMTGLQTAMTWLSGCGPDRSAYFQMLGADCTANEISSLESCKDTSCYDAAGGPCSIY